MSTKKIIDYIVVYGENAHTTFFERVNNKIKTLEKKVKSSVYSIKNIELKVDKYNALHEDFKIFSTYEVGEAYKAVSPLDLKNWRGGITYLHPLKSGAWSNEDIVITKRIKYDITKSLDKIRIKYQQALENLKKEKDTLSKYQKELSHLNSNSDPIVNKDFRTSFENEVHELLKKGYELQGGVSVSHDQSYQAMIKYEG
jgi:hypothetical protein